MTSGATPDRKRGRAERFDDFQRRHGIVGFTIAVIYKLFDDRGPYLAGLITYYATVSMFPLLLLFLSIVGYILHGDAHLQQQVVNSALGNLPGIGEDVRKNISGFKGNVGAAVVGVVGVVYGSLGAMQAAQYAFNTIYSVPRNLQPNPLRSRLRSVGLLAILGTGVLASSAVNLAVSTGNSISSQLGTGLTIAGYAILLAVNFGLFTAAFAVLTTEDLKARDVLKGGLVAAVAFETLQAVGVRYVQHEANHGSAFYGIFGVVLATIAWLYLEALVVIIAAEVNVVSSRRMWPRALLTPFTDRVELNPADREAYTRYAKAARFKGFERIEVTFGPPPGAPQPPPGSEGVTPPS